MLETLKALLAQILTNSPAWVVVIFIVIVGIIHYGPRYIKNWIEIREKLGKVSATYRNEYIAMLKTDKEKLEKKLDEKDKEIKDLQDELKGTIKRRTGLGCL